MEAHRRYYAFDLCPGFWDSLPQHHTIGHVLSIDKVRSEMGTGDILARWVEQTAPATLFDTTQTAAVVAEFTAMVRWVQNNPQFLPEAKAEFAAVADGWLAAYARAHNYTVVTQEVHRPEQRNRVPLPNVCIQFGVPYTDTFTMLRTLGTRFSLQT